MHDDQRRPERAELCWFDHGHRRCHGDNHHGQGGQEPARAPDPEPAQVQLPVPGPVVGEQVGDQVAAQDKKDINPEKPAVKRRELLMKGDNRKHGQRADTVETGRPHSAVHGRPAPFFDCGPCSHSAAPRLQQCSVLCHFGATGNPWRIIGRKDISTHSGS